MHGLIRLCQSTADMESCISYHGVRAFAEGVAPNMMAAQYYGMPGATPPPSWGVYAAQNAMMSGQQTPTPGTPQPAMMRSQSTRPVTSQQQQQDVLSSPGTVAGAMHTPGWSH